MYTVCNARLQTLVCTRYFITACISANYTCSLITSSVDLQPAHSLLDVCVGDGLEVTCTVGTSSLAWKIYGELHIFTSFSPVNSVMMASDIELKLVSSGQELVSIAMLYNISSNHNGTILICLNTILPNPPSEDMASITIIVQGKVIMHTNPQSNLFSLGVAFVSH